MVMSKSERAIHTNKRHLVQNFDEIAGIKLPTYMRSGAKENLWAEIDKIVTQRNKTLHQAEAATSADAEFAIAVASEIIERAFFRAGKETRVSSARRI